MGLSGRKTKQRIPNDPRNLAWANDANKFGAAYLAKLGWDPSRGLGVSGEGRTKALSVTQKLDMLGIGADHRDSAEGIAWKQNKDFENLLKRLNAANGKEEPDEAPMTIDGFVRPSVANEGPSSGTGEAMMDAEDGLKKEKKKRKKGVEDEGQERKKKRKKNTSSDDASDAEDSSQKKKKKKRDTKEEPAVVTAETELPPPSIPASKPSFKHPRAAFRGRHMAAKSLASKSSSAIAEILGISPAPSASVSGYPPSAPTSYPSTPYEPGPSTSSSSDPSGSATPAEEIKLQELTVSSKSVMDYFKEKLAAKSNARVSASTSISSPGTPAVEEDDYDERPRVGLGASKLRTEVARASETETVGVVERRALGGIGSGMRSSFAAMFASATVTSASTLTDAEASAPGAWDDVPAVQGGEEESPKSKKQRKERIKEKKIKKDKGKEKAKMEEPCIAKADAREEEGVDEKAERKRRKEEKKRRKEAEAKDSEVGVGVEGGGGVTDAEVKDRKRRKDKKKDKAGSRRSCT